MSEPSKYPVTYFSASKGKDLAIETMPTPHIFNALRKLDSQDVPAPAPIPALIAAFTAELTARGCVLDAETGRWSTPEVAP